MELDKYDLRIGSLVKRTNKLTKEALTYELVASDFTDIAHNRENSSFIYEAIPITEELLLKVGLSTINENSEGKRYGYVVNGIFKSDLTFTFWKTTKEAGKFFRRDLELKSFHQVQNIYWDLSNIKLKLI
jgi:hypothetical protein